MQIGEIWPFLLPGVLLQLLMQILCIVEGVKEDNRKPFQRVLYILSIAIFGLAAIAFHLLRAERTPPKDTTPAKVERANHLTNKGIFFLLLIAYQVMGLHMLAENVGTSTYIPLSNRFCRCCSSFYAYQSNTRMFRGITYFFPSLRGSVQSTTHRCPMQRYMESVRWVLIFWAARQEQ